MVSVPLLVTCRENLEGLMFAAEISFGACVE